MTTGLRNGFSPKAIKAEAPTATRTTKAATIWPRPNRRAGRGVDARTDCPSGRSISLVKSAKPPTPAACAVRQCGAPFSRKRRPASVLVLTQFRTENRNTPFLEFPYASPRIKLPEPCGPGSIALLGSSGQRPLEEPPLKRQLTGSSPPCRGSAGRPHRSFRRAAVVRRRSAAGRSSDPAAHRQRSRSPASFPRRP